MLRNILTILSLLFLAAHELRFGNSVACGFWLFPIALVFAPWPWKYLVLAVLLAFGAYLWTDITFHLVQERLAHGLPWLRLTAILGSVTLACLAGAIFNVLEMLQMRKR